MKEHPNEIVANSEQYLILALDISNSRTGFAVFDYITKELIKFGGVCGPKGKLSRTGPRK